MTTLTEREVKPYDQHDIIYREFHIGRSTVSYMPETDWTYSHDDYDGAEDSNDTRCGHAPSVEAAKDEIDDWWFEQSLKAVAKASQAAFHDKTIAMVKSVVGID